MSDPRLVLYGSELSGHCHKVALLLRMLGLPYRFAPAPAKVRQSDTFRKLNPFEQIPVLQDGDIVLADSNAILVYLVKRYAPGSAWLPDEPVAAAHVQRWLSIAAGEVRYGPGAARLMSVFGLPGDRDTTFEIAGRLLRFLDAHLAERTFLAAMPDQHRSFFALLPAIFAATRDAQGWPLATVLTGAPGFIQSPDPTTLRIAALPDRDDPAARTFADGREIGLLGIDLATRRRNRANGHIASRDAAGFAVAVAQSFGNCPQYIQRRDVRPAPRTSRKAERAESLARLDAAAQALIATADTFFVASAARPDEPTAGGCDISHRGGKPGFVRVDGDTLIIPDFRGNRYFNTLGNLLGEPRAGLLFVDFANGDLLQLQGETQIDWSGPTVQGVEGAERYWRFRVTCGWRRRAALPLRWSFVDYSPATLRTGAWRAAVPDAAE